MKETLLFTVALLISASILAQSKKDTEAVTKACMNYIEGFYEGDTVKIKYSLKPRLYKFGYWKDKASDTYNEESFMSYAEAIAYAKNVKEKKQFAPKTAPKTVEILDIGDQIAAAKITAWWGIDYMLLSKEGDKWMIEQVLWEGPLAND